MKKKIVSILLLTVLLCCLLPLSSYGAGVLPWEKKPPFAAATIQYRISGIEEGEEVLYLRDYGRERAIYHNTVAESMGVDLATSTVEIKTLKSIASYDLKSGQGERGANPQQYMIEEFNRLTAAEQERVTANAIRMRTAYAETTGGLVTENAEEILGYRCDRVALAGGSVSYLIHGTDIPLKTEVKLMGGVMSKEAVSITTEMPDDKFFQPPPNILPRKDPDHDKQAKNMARQAIAMLLKGTGESQTAARPRVEQEGTPKPADNGPDDTRHKQEEMLEGLKEIIQE